MTETETTTENQPTPQPQPRIPLPRYRSHKVIEAAKIVHVGEDSLILDPGDGRDQFVQPVTPEWITKHAPGPGRTSLVPGYFVRYADGYESFSPAKAFEEGYTQEPAPPKELPPAESEFVVREITGHRVNPANDKLVVEVMDGPGAGGASHLYRIRGFDSSSNPSCPFTKRYGKPAQHSTVLFQNGPIAEVGVNGVTHEVLLAILIDRFEAFQRGQYACPENDEALLALKAAQEALHRRTRARMQRGVEGTHRF